MTHSTRNILLGLGLGIATGLFLGERAGSSSSQPTVRPAPPDDRTALRHGLGDRGLRQPGPSQARRLFLRVGLLTIALWGLARPGVLTAARVPPGRDGLLLQHLPRRGAAPLDFISLYIPTNAFQSLADNVVPAVVLFSGFLGIALIGIERKDPLLSGLQVLEKVLSRANRFAVSLTPIGLFAIAADTVGTIDMDQVGRLRVFIIGYGAMSLLLLLDPARVGCLPDPDSGVASFSRPGMR